MAKHKRWSRQELLIAFGLYCQIPFGKLHSKNPDIIQHAEWIGRTPSSLAMKLTNIASIDPAIRSTGRKGLSGISSADKKMWEEMQNDWDNFVIESEIALSNYIKGKDNIDSLENFEENYFWIDKEVKSKARIGQNFFRRSVLSAYNYKCCITGLAIPTLLVASHIIPWRMDITNRLNPRNGLLLSMLHDKAFDLGIITISNDMTIKVSNKHGMETDYFFQTALKRYENKPIKLPEKFAPLEKFLSFHRENIFQG